MASFRRLYDLLRHLGEDDKWRAMLDYVGTPALYAIVFAIIFAETGLVVTPVLPGDSLLFAIGAIGARGIGINLPLVTVLLVIAAVAGVGRMNFFRFWLFNVTGGIAWVLICVAAGYFFGAFEFVKKRFELVIVAIVVISVLPMAFEFWQARRAAKRRGGAVLEATTTAESPDAR